MQCKKTSCFIMHKMWYQWRFWLLFQITAFAYNQGSSLPRWWRSCHSTNITDDARPKNMNSKLFAVIISEFMGSLKKIFLCLFCQISSTHIASWTPIDARNMLGSDTQYSWTTCHIYYIESMIKLFKWHFVWRVKVKHWKIAIEREVTMILHHVMYADAAPPR